MRRLILLLLIALAAQHVDAEIHQNVPTPPGWSDLSRSRRGIETMLLAGGHHELPCLIGKAKAPQVGEQPVRVKGFWTACKTTHHVPQPGIGLRQRDTG